MSITCPKCRLVNPEGAIRCDCGYDFVDGKMKESLLPTKQQKGLNVRQILFIFTASAIYGLLINFSSYNTAFGRGHLIGSAIAIFCITYFITEVTARIYWKFNQKTMPNLNIFVWVFWVIAIVLYKVLSKS